MSARSKRRNAALEGKSAAMKRPAIRLGNARRIEAGKAPICRIRGEERTQQMRKWIVKAA